MRRRALATTLAAAMVVMTLVGSGSALHAADGSGVVEVASGVPDGATAVLTNLTMVNGRLAGYVTADRCSTLTDGTQQWSNANHSVGSAVANLAVVPVDADGSFCLYHQRPVDLLADVQGWVGPASADSVRFVPIDPVRVMDTRNGTALPAGDSIVRVQTLAPHGAQAVLVNITMVDAMDAGYITAGLCESLVAGAQTFSNGNHLAGAAVSNLSVVPVDADGAFCSYRQRPVNLTVDQQGSFAPDPTGLGMTIEQPRRVLDTRTGATGATLPPADSIVRVDTGVAAGTEAVLVNIAMVDGRSSGYVTAGLCSTLVAGPQAFSNGNHVSATVSNLSVVPVDADGAFCIYHQRPVHVVVDVQGSFSPASTGEMHLVAPTRVLDTRPVATGATSCTSVVHIGDSTSVGLISPKVLADPADRIDAQYARVGVTDARMEISGARSIVERLPGQLNAYEVAQGQIAQGFHGCWVFALGTTDTANVAAGSSVSRRTRIDQMMTLVAGAPVMWVNVHTLETADPWSDAQMQAWNRELDLATQRYPNLKVYDWSSVAQPQWFGPDRIHYTADGYRQRARMIADALTVAYPA